MEPTTASEQQTAQQPHRIALIPSYEPDEKLLETVDAALAVGFTVVVVNDGSSPAYDEVYGRLPEGCTLLAYPVNGGVGHALKHGLSYIRKTYGTACSVVELDSDGQHKPADALRVIAAAESASNDVLALGVRDFGGPNVPARSRNGNHVASLLFSVMTGRKLEDTQTGLRAFKGSMIDAMLDIPGERYEYEQRVVFVLTRRGVTFKKVPIQTIYFENNSGSHFRTIPDLARSLVEIWLGMGATLAMVAVGCGVFALLQAIFHPEGAAIAIPALLGAACGIALGYVICRRFLHANCKVAPSLVLYGGAHLVLAGLVILALHLVFGCHPVIAAILLVLVVIVALLASCVATSRAFMSPIRHA